MATLICRIPKNGLPDAEAAKRFGIAAWLVPAQVTRDGQLASPGIQYWDKQLKNQQQFCLEWETDYPLNPIQEIQALLQFSHWLHHPNYLRWNETTPLWIKRPEHLSHRYWAAMRMKKQVHCRLALWAGGKEQGVFEGCYERPREDLRCRRLSDQRWDYESYLFHAHHKHVEPKSKDTNLYIPGILAIQEEEEGVYGNATSEKYNEWIRQSQSWARIWNGGDGQDALILIEDWEGHVRWYEPSCREPEMKKTGKTKLVNKNSNSSVVSWGKIRTDIPALAIHAFHLNVLPKILSEFSNRGGEDFNLYVSTPHEQLELTASILAGHGFNQGLVVGVDNRGRDIAPFVLELLPRIISAGHPWLLKLHTKQSDHLMNGQEWSEHLRQNLANANISRKIAGLFESERKLGLIAAPGTLIANSVALEKNEMHLAGLLKHLGVDGAHWLSGSFVAGSMFAARTAALTSLIQLPLLWEQFEPEASQVDGTLAHAVERIIATVIDMQGSHSMELPGESARVPQFGYSWAAPH